MLKQIKDKFWLIVGAIAVLAVIVFLRDMDRAEILKSFFRRKRVEEEVDKIKRSLAVEEGQVEDNERKMLELAEELKKQKVNVKEASDEQIRDYYKNLFK
jgi:hypothetical protein